MQAHLAASDSPLDAAQQGIQQGTQQKAFSSSNRVPGGSRAATVAILCAVWLLVAPRLQAQDDTDLRVLQAMCRAGLADSAIAYVTHRQELVKADRGLAAKWTMLLMECHAQGGMFADSDAELFWERCRSVYTQFIQADPDNPRQPWLQWQLARCELLHAQADTAQYLAAPANAQPRQQALARIRQILTELESVEDDLQQRQPRAAREEVSGGSQAPAIQLAALTVDVGLLRCETLLLRTRLYPRGSSDRIASATEVDQQATAILQRTERDWASRAQLQVAAATARLELGQHATALRELEQLAISADNHLARRRAGLTAIEALANIQADGLKPDNEQPDNGQPTTSPGDSLAARLSRGHALLENLQSGGSDPEVELASLQLSLAAVARSDGPEQVAAQQPEQAAAQQAALQALVVQAQQLGRHYGAYWQSRGEALLVGPIAAAAGDDSHHLSTELMLVAVRQLLAAGDVTAAVERLLTFRDHEAAAGRGTIAVRSGSQAAALLQQQQQWTAAAAAITDVSRQFVELPEAAEAHRQAIFYWSQALRAQADDPQLAENYTRLLKEQLELWPEAPATDEVAGWLTQWLIQTGHRGELADAWLQRAVNSTQPAIAEQALLDWLGELLHLDNPADVQRQLSALRRSREAGEWTISQAKSEALSWIASVTALETTDERLRQAVQALSQLQLESNVDADAKPDADADVWVQLTRAVRWLWALRQQQSLETLSPELVNWQPAELPTKIRQGLAPRLVAAIDETPTAEHAQWAQRMQLGDSWRELLLESREPRVLASGYRLLAWSVDASAGLDGLTALSHKAGRGGGPLQLELANALADSGPNRWQQSNALAKTVVANSPAGSELNWRARWRLVKNHLLQGQISEAQTLAQLWLATAPADAGLWTERFEGVLSEQPGNN